MDKVDKLLVQLLQQNARYSLKELSEQVYLSSPAVAFRIAKLEEKKIITGYHAEVSPEQLGYHITAYMTIAMQPKKKQAFLPFIAEFPNVLECSVVAGEKSVVLKAMFPSMPDLDAFIGKVQKFGHTETYTVLSDVIPSRGISVGEN